MTFLQIKQSQGLEPKDIRTRGQVDEHDEEDKVVFSVASHMGHSLKNSTVPIKIDIFLKIRFGKKNSRDS